MEIAIIVALVVLITLVGLLLFRGRRGDVSSGVQATLREEFLKFQSSIHTEMASAQQGMEGAKDLISQNALKTLEQIHGMGETVQRLVHQQEEAQRLGQSLKDLLQAPKLRGSYGEAILEELLDRVLPAGIWERQHRLVSGEIVDCVVRFREVVVPIDAKFPRDDYVHYLEAESDEDRARYWKRFEAAVKTQITSIKAKYIRPEQGTTEFALMFIPSEAIYYETIAEKNYLGHPSTMMEHAQQNHVMPVGPNTFYAFLQIVILSLKNVEIVKNARHLQEGLARLERDFRLFHDRFQDMGRAIERASDAYRVGGGHVDRYKDHLGEVLQMQALQGPEPPGPAPAALTSEISDLQGEDS